MQLNNRYNKVFGRIPILGMIHLGGSNPVKRALEEIAIFEEEGVNGAIIENYYGSVDDVIKTLQETSRINPKVVIGVNILPNEFDRAFLLAHEYGADFIQLDYAAGRYSAGELDLRAYSSCKEKYPEIIVLGGVWPKYYHPVKGSDLEKDLQDGKSRAEAIVVTGAGTGKETPLNKIKKFREVIGDHPLVVGSGLTVENAYEQLLISNGAIVGTYFKRDGNTRNRVDNSRVRDFMTVVKKAREYQEK